MRTKILIIVIAIISISINLNAKPINFNGDYDVKCLGRGIDGSQEIAITATYTFKDGDLVQSDKDLVKEAKRAALYAVLFDKDLRACGDARIESFVKQLYSDGNIEVCQKEFLSQFFTKGAYKESVSIKKSAVKTREIKGEPKLPSKHNKGGQHKAKAKPEYTKTVVKTAEVLLVVDCTKFRNSLVSKFGKLYRERPRN